LSWTTIFRLTSGHVKQQKNLLLNPLFSTEPKGSLWMF
jgi:hypothetical protein